MGSSFSRVESVQIACIGPLTERDDGRAPRVVLINESMARQFWPNGNPVGERITLFKGEGPQYEEPPRQVIGVVADIKDHALGRKPKR